MDEYDFVYKEEVDFDRALDEMDSKSKYNKVLSIFKEGKDRSKAFKNGAQLILHFAKTFKNFDLCDFRGAVHKSRAQYKEIIYKSDEDKKYMFFLYLELIKESTRMTKIQFFDNIWKTGELSDYIPFFIYFGRIFATESELCDLKTVVNCAKIGLGEGFKDVEELVKFENLANSGLNPQVPIVYHLFKEHKDVSYVEVFLSKYKNVLYPDFDKVEDCCEGIIDKIDEKNSPNLSFNSPIDSSEGKENVSLDISRSTIINFTDNVLKEPSFLKDEGKKKLGDTYNLETISFCTNISNKLVSAFSETLPPQDASSIAGFTLDSTLPPPEFFTPKPVDLKRTRSDVLLAEKKTFQDKEFSVFEDENLTRTQVYVDQTGDIDDILEDDVGRSPLRKKTNYMRNHTDLVGNISTVIEEEDILIENSVEKSVEEDVMDVEEKTYEHIPEVPETPKASEILVVPETSNNKEVLEVPEILGHLEVPQLSGDYGVPTVSDTSEPSKIVEVPEIPEIPDVPKVVESSFQSPNDTKDSKFYTSDVISSGKRSNDGSVNSFDFKGSFTIPTKADEDTVTLKAQKNAPRPSLMTASTPCRGSQPMQMDECSFYLDLSEIKGDDEDLISKPIVEEEKCSLFADKDVTIQAPLQTSGVHLLSPSNLNATEEPPKAKNEEFLFDVSDSHVSESNASVDIFQFINNKSQSDEI
ncbi:Hypothetical protein SRAE_2000142400 [Strongyloides ratti]|uniref:Uncharacterized protein n=1 Tax=Strongyloides ratti TaxID=34506 RepID=A0A090LF59_STRRB|nr:Hypothetical protein SRAE_2000142400 [Strongyloides ratti]CEF66758.1 Hypothetical protein SRAE_2000142400 [Strongyloides ratti]